MDKEAAAAMVSRKLLPGGAKAAAAMESGQLLPGGAPVFVVVDKPRSRGPLGLLVAGMFLLVVVSFPGWTPFNAHKFFLSVPCNETAAANLKEITKVPHVAGTQANSDVSTYIRAKFEEVGLESHFADYDVLLNYPLRRQLSLVFPELRHLALKEAAFPEDPFSQHPDVTTTFHGYSPSGSAEAEVVFVNYGRTEDFAALAARGVNLTGAITLAKYGQIYRGDKVSNSAKAGAIATLVYSDPQDWAGSLTEGVYPRSKWLPPSGVQRGSAGDGKGDFTTPGWPSTPGCERLPIDPPHPDLDLPKIPSQPISYGDATPILQALGGDAAPPEWWGALDLDYKIGRGPARVRLELEMNLTLGPIRNVIAIVKGAVEPDRYVILGNHHDAWVFGAVDPNSGTSAMLEVARGLGALLKRGWRPRRTIVLCSWDAEEYALIGSTEWVEDNEDLLSARAVAYLNVDEGVTGAGILNGGATPQLDGLLLSCAKQVADPKEPGRSLYDTWLAQANETKDGSAIPKVGRLGGAGTDYAGFLQHLGIASIDMSIKLANDSDYPVYHSAYDNFHWMSNFGDPGFHHHVAVAKVWGLAALRLADDTVLPFDYTNYWSQLQKDVMELKATLEEQGAAGNVTLEPITRATSAFGAAAASINKEVEDLKGSSCGKANRRPDELNDRLMLTERAFVAPAGIPGRPWFRHLVYAPPADNGYGTLVFPAIRDALSAAAELRGANKWQAVQHEVHQVARAIVKASKVLGGGLH